MLVDKTERRKNITQAARNIPVDSAKKAIETVQTTITILRTAVVCLRVMLSDKNLPNELKVVINRMLLLLVNTDKTLVASIGKNDRPSSSPPVNEHAIALTSVIILLSEATTDTLDIIADIIDTQTRMKLFNQIREMSDEEYKEWATNHTA